MSDSNVWSVASLRRGIPALAALSVTFTACGTDDTSGTNDGTPQVFQDYCERYLACEPADYEDYFATVGDCVEYILEAEQSYVDYGGPDCRDAWRTALTCVNREGICGDSGVYVDGDECLVEALSFMGACEISVP